MHTEWSVEHCPDARSFVNELQRSAARWSDNRGENCVWSFRGQSDAKWDICPGALRVSADNRADGLLGEYIERVKRRKPLSADEWTNLIGAEFPRPAHVPHDSWRSRLKAVGELALAQIWMVRDFASIANEAKHEVPYWRHLYQAHDPASAEFISYIGGDFFFADTFVNEKQITCIAQHHGIPTVLLDITWHPWVAAYFAAEKAARGECRSEEIAVFCIHDAVIVEDSNLSRVTLPPGLVPYLDAQHAYFLYGKTFFRDYVQTGLYPKADDLLGAASRAIRSDPSRKLSRDYDISPHDPLLVKLTLDARHALDVLRILWKERISPPHLRPTFDHVTDLLKVRSKWNAADGW